MPVYYLSSCGFFICWVLPVLFLLRVEILWNSWRGWFYRDLEKKTSPENSEYSSSEINLRLMALHTTKLVKSDLSVAAQSTCYLNTFSLDSRKCTYNFIHDLVLLFCFLLSGMLCWSWLQWVCWKQQCLQTTETVQFTSISSCKM